MKRYDIESYRTEEGEVPFRTWLEHLKDATAQTAVVSRIDRASFGNFGDYKALAGAKGLFEMRIHYGQGYRIFYTVIDQKIVLLLAGSTKQAQTKVLKQAQLYLADYSRRTKQ